MTKFYRDADGNYLGGFDGADPPEGAIEVPKPPDHADQRWNGTGWDMRAPERRLVAKTLIIDRLAQSEKLGAARLALDASDLYTRERWNARTHIYADDPSAVGLLQSIGADPAVILAP